LCNLKNLLSKQYVDAEMVKFVAKLESESRNVFFMFKLFRGVDPTNGHAERGSQSSIEKSEVSSKAKRDGGVP
jgi:hypothetical protein